MISIKKLAETPDLDSIPPTYVFTRNPNDDQLVSDDPEHPIPVIDFSLLTSGTPDQLSKVVHDLGFACQDWGFFMVINHGVPESLMKAMREACEEFFNLTEEEKQEFAGKHALDPIRCGTSFNTSANVLFWRDFLKVFVHPKFHSPSKPSGFREISLEYTKRTRNLARELLKGISASLSLEDGYMEKTLNLESGFQHLAVNFYPPCPQPELAMGLPPHSDHGLLTLLMQNGICGLQIQHKGKWVNVNSSPNAFVVNLGDQMEVLSNGKHKSVLHRATVNEKATRISIATVCGPSLDTVVCPAPALVDHENNPPAYTAMKYGEYLELQQRNTIDGKSNLDRLRILAI